MRLLPLLLLLLCTIRCAPAQQQTPFTGLSVSYYDEGYRINATPKPFREDTEWSLDGGPFVKGNPWGLVVPKAGTHRLRVRVLGQPGTVYEETITTRRDAPDPSKPLWRARTAALPPGEGRGRGLIQRVQPSKRLVYVPRLDVKLDSTEGRWNPEAFPEFRLAKGDRAVYYSRQDLGRYAKPMLRRGWTHISGFAPAGAPKDTPFTQRVEIMYQNAVEAFWYGQYFTSGQVPRGDTLRQLVALMNGSGSHAGFDDQRQAEELIYDIETWPRGGPEGGLWKDWFDVFRIAGDDYRQRHNGQHRAWATGIMGLDPTSVTRQDGYDVVGYFKFQGINYKQDTLAVQQIWHEHDFYVPQITRRLADFQQKFPGRFIANFWSPYYEDVCSTDDGRAYRTYRHQRPDVAENAAVLFFVNGSKEIVAWSSGEIPTTTPEQHFTRGLWRLAQLNDIREGTNPTLTRPRVSYDGGRTYQLQPDTDFDWGTPRDWSHRRNGKKVPKEPFVYLLRSAAGYAVLAIQPDQLDATAVRDVWVELPDGTQEPLRLYGRELCIVRTPPR